MRRVVRAEAAAIEGSKYDWMEVVWIVPSTVPSASSREGYYETSLNQ